MSELNSFAWTPSELPSVLTMKSIPANVASSVASILSSAALRITTVGAADEFITLSNDIRGAQATLAIVSAQEVLETATDSSVMAEATQIIFENTVNLHDLYDSLNFYDLYLNRFGNIFYFAVFSIIMIYLLGMVSKSRYWWFNIAMGAGFTLEWMGFLGRVLAFTDDRSQDFFLLQYVALTISPAFMMAGIYFLFAQLVVMYGRQYSILKPMWYSYFFIAIDVASLAVQAVGGAMASVATTENKDPTDGTNTMIAGISVQVFGMSIFMLFWFEFLNRIYFHDSKLIETDTPYKKRSFSNFFRLLFNMKSIRLYRQEELDKYYAPQYKSIRQNRFFNWFPIALTTAVTAIYIRSCYRVVELAQGFSGYLITHEVYLFTLDALFIALAGLIFIPFHPVWIFGKQVAVSFSTIKNTQAGKDIEDQCFGYDGNSMVETKTIPLDSSSADTTMDHHHDLTPITRPGEARAIQLELFTSTKTS